jgi:hypothetical protein
LKIAAAGKSLSCLESACFWNISVAGHGDLISQLNLALLLNQHLIDSGILVRYNQAPMNQKYPQVHPPLYEKHLTIIY